MEAAPMAEDISQSDLTRIDVIWALDTACDTLILEERTKGKILFSSHSLRMIAEVIDILLLYNKQDGIVLEEAGVPAKKQTWAIAETPEDPDEFEKVANNIMFAVNCMSTILIRHQHQE
jgi:hypothetical protein